ncbi:MAG: hypothetical protein ACM3ZQ_00310 [Bacillota bacterium]
MLCLDIDLIVTDRQPSLGEEVRDYARGELGRAAKAAIGRAKGFAELSEDTISTISFLNAERFT